MRFNDLTLMIDSEKTTEDVNFYKMISTEELVNDFNNMIGIIGEDGCEVSLTAGKFIELFDEKGLEGFII